MSTKREKITVKETSTPHLHKGPDESLSLSPSATTNISKDFFASLNYDQQGGKNQTGSILRVTVTDGRRRTDGNSDDDKFRSISNDSSSSRLAVTVAVRETVAVTVMVTSTVQ